MLNTAWAQAASEGRALPRGVLSGRDADEALVPTGEDDGLNLNDTCLFLRFAEVDKEDPDWEGFGRVVDVGPGGTGGKAEPSRVEIIADYDGDESHIVALKYPLTGLQLGLSAGLLPISHAAMNLAAGSAVGEVGFGRAALALQLLYRLGWLPLTELYLTTNAIVYVDDDPVGLMFLEPGLEKGWLWGRLVPLVGARYSLGRVGLAVPDTAGTDTATTLAHGVEGYGGLKIFLSPDAAFYLHGGYRHFAGINQLRAENDTFFFRSVYSKVWVLHLSGAVVRLGATYEF